jgi:antitoxin component HigA of HigAB toxin-antitoxin module
MIGSIHPVNLKVYGQLVADVKPNEAVTQVLAGKKAIDPDRAQVLADRFKLSPSIFLE